MKQLEAGLDNHRAEVGDLKKQLGEIQEKRNEQDSDDERFNDGLAIEAPFDDNDGQSKIKSKCHFRTDIDPRPDIQVRGYYIMASAESYLF